MDLRLKESTEWRQCAIVEIPDSSPDIIELIRDDSLAFRADRAKQSPAGYHWYDIYVDASSGERRVARTAWAVLTALKRSAKQGYLQSLRIINGEHWLRIGESSADL